MARHSVQGQVVWITGASAGIGAELARQYARQDAFVVVSARRKERLDQICAEIEREGKTALAVPCDVTDEAQLEQSVAAIVDRFGQLDIAIANAGFAVSGRVDKLTAADWRRQFDTNVVGAALTARFAMPHLRTTQGRIVLVGSVASYVPAYGNGPYAMSKAAVRMLGQTLSLECAPHGVSCTTIHPGYVESDIARVDNQGEFDATRKDGRPAWLMWPTEKAARVMIHAIARREREFVFTAHGRAAAFVGQHLPSMVLAATKLGRQLGQ